MKDAKENNSFGVKYLSKARAGKGLYAVKIEIACSNGRHGKMLYLYEGNNKEYATDLANKVNALICKAKIDAINFHDWELDEWTFNWNEHHKDNKVYDNRYLRRR